MTATRRPRDVGFFRSQILEGALPFGAGLAGGRDVALRDATGWVVHGR